VAGQRVTARTRFGGTALLDRGSGSRLSSSSSRPTNSKEIRERLKRIVGIDWQILYSPIALLALVLWLFVARRLRQIGVGLGLLLAGTVCGIASQVAGSGRIRPGDERTAAFDEVMVFEELVEMVAALLIGLALLTALQALNRRARA